MQAPVSVSEGLCSRRSSTVSPAATLGQLLVCNLRNPSEKKPEAPKLSKKKLRRMNRFTVAELKQLVARPDVVEMHDVTAQDPKLLVHLKATRNSVPVPRHWCFKRKYLQGKRGIEKPPFELPDFIKRTGIQEMREALQEKVRVWLGLRSALGEPRP
ncbi:Splicing factor 3B subunit 2 [Myotis brandtii]|uniref:Splicing factor 3B subunit 2 n=2 Tax=Myotis brandtii TaxID=109478 RepID=S7PGD1_MYOBR|nr:Splicing factor 3B subunit 2 [Myotis brandtii]